MNEDVITDLKQFIATTVSQQLTEQLSQFEEKMNKRFDKRFGGLEKEVGKVNKKLDNLAAGVADALEASTEVLQDRINNHERRIGTLEHRPHVV